MKVHKSDRWNMEETPESHDEYERARVKRMERDIELADYLLDAWKDDRHEHEQLTGTEPHSA